MCDKVAHGDKTFTCYKYVCVMLTFDITLNKNELDRVLLNRGVIIIAASNLWEKVADIKKRFISY